VRPDQPIRMNLKGAGLYRDDELVEDHAEVYPACFKRSPRRYERKRAEKPRNGGRKRAISA